MAARPGALFSGDWRGAVRRLFRSASEATMKSRLVLCIVAALMAGISHTWAHEARPAFLEIKETAPGRYSVLWRTPVLAGMRLPVVLKFPDGVRDINEPVTQWLTDSVVERRVIEAGTCRLGMDWKRLHWCGRRRQGSSWRLHAVGWKSRATTFCTASSIFPLAWI